MSSFGPAGEPVPPPVLAVPTAISAATTIPGPPPQPTTSTQNKTVGVPAFEPPAPMSLCMRSRGVWVRWWLDRARELPSWMTSMVVHLAITILFASLAVKSGPRPNAVFVLDLSATLADPHDADANAIEIIPWDFDPQAASRHDATPTLARRERQIVPPIDVPVLDAGFLEPRVANGAAEAIEPVASAEAVPADTVEFLGKIPGSAPSDDDLPYVVSIASATSGNLRGQSPRSVQYDDIVERFIQYDIGNLPGVAGKQALHAFNQLGPDALAALVRGLNRSAQLRASCPVVVISSKLEQTLQQSQDGPMIDYVLENLGRGVPGNAPHALRLESLREQLAGKYVDRQFYRDFVKVRPIGNESRSRWVARVKRLYRADADELARSLEDAQIEERTAAWAAIAMRERPELAPAERMRLAQLLLNDWTDHSDSYRKRIHDALATLAAGSGVAEEVPSFSRQQSNGTRRQWQQWWNEHGSTVPDIASAELMRLAKFANQRTSQRLLARTIDKFPGTHHAELARHMLAPDAKLALAFDLEKQNRWTEAIGLYEEVALEFPDSQHAVTARERLSVIGRFDAPRRAATK